MCESKFITQYLHMFIWVFSQTNNQFKIKCSRELRRLSENNQSVFFRPKLELTSLKPMFKRPQTQQIFKIWINLLCSFYNIHCQRDGSSSWIRFCFPNKKISIRVSVSQNVPVMRKCIMTLMNMYLAFELIDFTVWYNNIYLQMRIYYLRTGP